MALGGDIAAIVHGTAFFAELEWLDFPRRFAYQCHNISATLVKLFAYLTKGGSNK